ncbi:methylmalonyl-CoA mutase family protein [Anaerolineales bacterium HSG25]|nr:methylmalonyl-CoA mutase family protein [Anaerolineales bacterium HSG25]
MTTDSATPLTLDEFDQPTYEAWRELVEQQLRGAPFEKKVMTKTYEGITLQPLYRQEDATDLPNQSSFPGLPPYTRGSQVSGNLKSPWLICQELAYSTPSAFNQALKYDLERGQTAINLRLDQATLAGLDPDQAEVGQVGAGGVSIVTVADLATAFEGIDLSQLPIFVQASSAAMPTLALLVAYLNQAEVPLTNLRGAIEMDPLGSLVSAGTFPRSVAGAYDRMTQMIRWAKNTAPQLQIVTVHGQPYSNGGASAVQELAFVMATAVEYLRELNNRGLSINEIAPRLRFSFTAGSNYFMAIAKLRAARLVWAKLVKAFGGDETAQKMSMHVRTANWNKTKHDAHVNMLRTTTEAFASAVGGCDSLHVGQFDEVFGQPDEFSRRIARNTQIILQREAHLTRVIDPAGGSWYVENLTDAVGREAWSLFQQVEQNGGMYQVLQADFPQSQIQATAEQRDNHINSRKDVFIGTNKYANLTEKPITASVPDYPALHEQRAKHITDYRTSLDGQQATTMLEKLNHLLEAPAENALQAAIEVASAGATIGEIARTLRSGDETKATVTPILAGRATIGMETLRQNAEAYLAKTGQRPQIFLANMGPIPQHKPRADFSTDFFQVGGFEMLGNNGFETPDAAAKSALESGASVVVICSTDATYPEIVPTLTKALKSAKPEITVIVAGYPKAHIDEFKAAGVDEFIHVRADLHAIVSKLQTQYRL